VFSGSLANNWKTVKFIVFYIMQLPVNFFEFYETASRNLFDMCNKVLSLHFAMANLNLSSFLGNVYWKVVKQLKNSDIYSILHNATACQLISFFEYASTNLFHICNKVLSLIFGITNPNSSSFLAVFSGSLTNNWKTVKFIVFYIMQLPVNLFEFFENASRNLLDMCTNVLSIHFGMANLYSSSFLGNSYWKVVKQLKYSDF